MKRNFEALDDGPFDLLVIGGGIYGAWTAYDAALRSLKVALVEREDWASGTSSASSKLIHGGLRYLRHFWFGLVRKSLEERRRLLRLAPHQVRPIEFHVPIYRGRGTGRLPMKAGLILYDLLAGRDGLFRRHRYVSREDLLGRFPFLEDSGLQGGYAYGDGIMDDARFVLEIVAGAAKSGAMVVNRAVVRSLLRSGDRVEGAVVEDVESGRWLELRASVTVNTTGASVGDALGLGAPGEGLERSRSIRLTKGVHLLFPALPTKSAFLLSTRRDGRVIFLIPWYGRTMLGTTDTVFEKSVDQLRVEEKDVAYLLEEANAVLGANRLEEADIVGSFAGIRTLIEDGRGDPSSNTREWSLEEPLSRLLVSVGGKYTSARTEAAHIVDRVCQILGRGVHKAPTEDKPFPWCPPEPFGAWKSNRIEEGVGLGLDQETAASACRRFGTSVKMLYGIIAGRPDLSRRIDPEVPFAWAEVVHAVENEMARSLSDVLRRRNPLTLLTRIEEKTLARAAELAGESLSWSRERMADEIEALSILDSQNR